MNEKFTEYFRENFFTDESELKDFLKSLERPLKKTIRINTNKISVTDFQNKVTKKGWTLTPTNNPVVFYVDREDTSIALGHTLEHLIGEIYIQELSASQSVFHLTEWKVDYSPFTILDMASSPGGKTTQLSEAFPHSFIVANEFTQDRIVQLISNIERMGSSNIAVSNYNGIFFANLPETFDRILLDAPCSGEGIGFKAIETIKYWNIKNIKKIARLQEKLFESAIISLKTGGELLYSTCTLNMFENEGVIHAVREKYPDTFDVIFQKRFWPHKEVAGGFFVARIVKKKPIAEAHAGKSGVPNLGIEKLSKHENTVMERFFEMVGADLGSLELYKYKKDILVIEKNPSITDMLDSLYYIKFGKRIGKIEESKFIPNYYFWRDFELSDIEKYDIRDEAELHEYLTGKEFTYEWENDYIQIRYKGTNIGLWLTDSARGKITNLFPREWMRK